MLQWPWRLQEDDYIKWMKGDRVIRMDEVLMKCLFFIDAAIDSHCTTGSFPTHGTDSNSYNRSWTGQTKVL